MQVVRVVCVHEGALAHEAATSEMLTQLEKNIVEVVMSVVRAAGGE